MTGTLWASVVAKMNFTCGGRLLERLQERVERARREHVDFVDDVDLEAVARGPERDATPAAADVVDAVVGRAVDLDARRGRRPR